jgi:hypothetical protein
VTPAQRRAAAWVRLVIALASLALVIAMIAESVHLTGAWHTGGSPAYTTTTTTRSQP